MNADVVSLITLCPSQANEKAEMSSPDINLIQGCLHFYPRVHLDIQ